jgi:flagellar P-ring protein FlgI
VGSVRSNPAVAQGAVVVGGLQVQGQAQSVKQGVTTSDLIPGGALVERPRLFVTHR